MALTDPVYCPVCGYELHQEEVGGRVRPACTNCGYVHYVNPVPGVGMLIEMDGGLVLIKRGNPPHQHEWTLPGGFVEADESAEEAAIREAEEETGLKVEITELAAVNSFPEGPPTSGIMIFFRMRPVGGELRAGDDAVDVRVFQPDDLPLLPFRTHREMVSEWLARQGQSLFDHPRLDVQIDADFIIRPADAADMDEIGALLQLIPINREIQRDEWPRIVQRFREVPGLQIFVAQTRQSPPLVIGFVSVSVIRTLTEGIGFINDMAVLPTYQRRGVGAALLESVMQHAIRLDLRTLIVNSQRANEQARAFFISTGFVKDDTLRLRIR